MTFATEQTSAEDHERYEHQQGGAKSPPRFMRAIKLPQDLELWPDVARTTDSATFVQVENCFTVMNFVLRPDVVTRQRNSPP
jgi:hypothetical protein